MKLMISFTSNLKEIVDKINVFSTYILYFRAFNNVIIVKIVCQNVCN